MMKWNYIVMVGLLITPIMQPMDSKAQEQAPTDKVEEKMEAEKTFVFPPVTVTTERVAEESRLSDPVPNTGVNREQIDNRANRRVGEILKRMPGVYMGGAPGENNDVRLRGLDKEFTRIQLDDMTLPDGGEKRELQVIECRLI